MDSASSETTAHAPLRSTIDTGLKIVIVCGFGVGKTTMVNSVSEIRPLSTEETMTRAGIGIDDAGTPKNPSVGARGSCTKLKNNIDLKTTVYRLRLHRSGALV